MTHAFAIAAAVAATLVISTQHVTAQDYPTKPIRMVVANQAGGPVDVVTRIYAAKLGELIGQQIVIDNRVGAGGSVAGEIVTAAPADGYTLAVVANGTVAIAPHILTLRYNAAKDLAPVALLGNSPLALMVYPGLPAKSVKELIALARAKPGAINFGSSQQGSTAHLSAELFKSMAGIDITHVPYKGAAQALVGVMAGEVQMLISGLSAAVPAIKSGQVRALAITSPKRLAVMPDLPTIAETVPGYEADSWYAILTRAGTPRGIINKINEVSVKAINSPDVQSRLVAAGIATENLTPDQLGAKIRKDTERWGKVVKAAGVQRQ
jgi:tripartite-type tricarboxylate transporter receptor subunit TctC